MILEAGRCNENVIADSSREVNVDEANMQYPVSQISEDLDDSDWEDGSVHTLDGTKSDPMTIEFSEMEQAPDSTRRKPIRRASAADKVKLFSSLLLTRYLILLQILNVLKF